MRTKPRYLVTIRKGAEVYHYWRPSAAFRRLGWQGRALVEEPGGPSIEEQAEALNRELDAWQRTAGPASVRLAARRGTVAWLIGELHGSDEWARLAARTRRDVAAIVVEILAQHRHQLRPQHEEPRQDGRGTVEPAAVLGPLPAGAAQAEQPGRLLLIELEPLAEHGRRHSPRTASACRRSRHSPTNSSRPSSSPLS